MSSGERFARAAAPESPVSAFGVSAINSALFGVPELVTRRFGAGPFFEQMRQDYPMASGAGDIAGLASPVRLGINAGRGLVNAIGRRAAPEVVESAGQKALNDSVVRNMETYQRAVDRYNIQNFRAAQPGASRETIKAAQQAKNDLDKMAAELAKIEKTAQKNAAGGVVRQGFGAGAQVTGGIMGLQAGVGGLTAARSPENPSGGFQQGATGAGQAVQQYNPLQVVPGVPQVTQGVTQIVPGFAGYGGMVVDQALIETDRLIREAAARRALGQTQ
jgi:hypothetical protein